MSATRPTSARWQRRRRRDAGGGNDWVYAAGAADRVCGNSGNDHLFAGDAADLVYGGSGDDQAYGEAGTTRSTATTGRMPCTAPPARTASRATRRRLARRRLRGRRAPRWHLEGRHARRCRLLFGADGTDSSSATTPRPTSRPPALPDRPRFVRLHARRRDYLVGWRRRRPRLRRSRRRHRDTAATGTTPSRATPAPTVSGEPGDDDLVGGSSEFASGAFSGSEPGRPDAADCLLRRGRPGRHHRRQRPGDPGRPPPGDAGRGLTATRGVDLADESSARHGRVRRRPDPGGGDIDVVFGQRGDDDVSLGDGGRLRRGRPGRRRRARRRRGRRRRRRLVHLARRRAPDRDRPARRW